MHNVHNNESVYINYVKYITCIKCNFFFFFRLWWFRRQGSAYWESRQWRRTTTRPGSIGRQHESPGRPGFLALESGLDLWEFHILQIVLLQWPGYATCTSGGSHRANRAKQPIWFVPVRPVRVIRTFRGGLPEPSANQIWSWTNIDQTRFCHYQTKCKPIVKVSEPWTNLFWGLQFLCQTLSEPMSLID